MTYGVWRRYAVEYRIRKEILAVPNDKDDNEWNRERADECRDRPSDAEKQEVLANQSPNLPQQQRKNHLDA
jgi:hypothetical protein